MARKRKGRDISGWLVVDKPAGPTSTAVVNKVRWALDAKKAGHAGTLDPDATGVLAVALGEAAAPTVPASGTSLSLAEQLNVQCTDGTATEDCVPTCTADLHGFQLLLNIDGEDSKLSCELHHALYSWVGAATDGGYLGSDFQAFFSAVVSGAAGVYVGMLVEAARISTMLVVTPGQSVSVVGDPSMLAPAWCVRRASQSST